MVESSKIKIVGDDRRFELVYRYDVAGQIYTSQQIGFDIFGKPGGRGQPDTLLERYPAGAVVEVYVKPDQPDMAILEPGNYSPLRKIVLPRRELRGGWLRIFIHNRLEMEKNDATPKIKPNFDDITLITHSGFGVVSL